jgi:hypothetical protein
MPSAVWSEHLHFGLVAMPVRLLVAARTKTTRFRRLYRKPVVGCCFRRNRKPSFNVLQSYGSSAGAIFYYVFDVLVLRGRDVMRGPLVARRGLLENPSCRSYAIPSDIRVNSGLVCPTLHCRLENRQTWF